MLTKTIAQPRDTITITATVTIADNKYHIKGIAIQNLVENLTINFYLAERKITERQKEFVIIKHPLSENKPTIERSLLYNFDDSGIPTFDSDYDYVNFIHTWKEINKILTIINSNN